MQSRLTFRRPPPLLLWGLVGGALLTVLLAAPGCTLQGAAEALLPEADVRHAQDLAYGPAERQALDVYRPRRGAEQPVVVFLHGGRWQYGSKAQYRLLGRTLAQHGVVTVVPNYRLYPSATFPAWVNDAAAAVRWTYNHVHRFGGDATQLYVVGHSAGAHTATLLALDGQYLRKAGVPPRSSARRSFYGRACGCGVDRTGHPGADGAEGELGGHVSSRTGGRHRDPAPAAARDGG